MINILIMSPGSIEGRPMGVIGRKLGMDPGQVKNGSNPANGMIVRYRLLKAERIKQLSLFVIEPPHHRPPPQRIASQRANHSTPKPSTTFATKSAQSGHIAAFGVKRTSFARSEFCRF